MNNFEPVSVMGATYTKFGNRGLGEGGWGCPTGPRLPSTWTIFPRRSSASPMARPLRSIPPGPVTRERRTSKTCDIFGTEAGAYAAPGASLPGRSRASRFGYETLDDLNVPLKMPHQERLPQFRQSSARRGGTLRDHDQALVVQKILDGIAESNRTGREVRLA